MRSTKTDKICQSAQDFNNAPRSSAVTLRPCPTSQKVVFWSYSNRGESKVRLSGFGARDVIVLALLERAFIHTRQQVDECEIILFDLLIEWVEQKVYCIRLVD